MVKREKINEYFEPSQSGKLFQNIFLFLFSADTEEDKEDENGLNLKGKKTILKLRPYF